MPTSPLTSLIGRPAAPMDLLRLLWRVDQALGSLSRQMLRSFGVTSPQRVVLRALVGDPSITAATLSSALRVDRSTVTGILARMEGADLILRAPHDEDGRKQRIVLTEEGRRLDGLQHGTVEAAMNRTVAGMAPGELAAVCSFLVRFSEEVEREQQFLLQPRALP
jgi:DNA-binding MarR family transcriptional regulator